MRDATHYLGRIIPANTPPEEIAGHIARKLASVPLDPAADVATARHSVAVVANHGRWVVECPDCTGALLAAPADRRFLCVDCGNVAIGGKYRPVVWPREHQAIAQLLDPRQRQLANWIPGETLEQLRDENALLAQGPTLITGTAAT